MFRLSSLLIFVFAILQTVSSLTDVEKACINTYSNAVSNDFLLGTWYEVYKFSFNLNLPPSTSCIKTVITKPTPSEVQKYVDFYKLENPYSFGDNPILLDRFSGYFMGMLMGHKEAKFYVFDPKSYFARKDYYDARVYEKVNEDYVLYQKCSMRGHTKWLISRKNSTTEEELADVLKIIRPKVKDYQTQRFCA